MIRSDLHVDNTGDVLREGITRADGNIFLVNPTEETMRELVSIFGSIETPPEIRLFADEGPLKDLTEDFIVASTIADLVDEDLLSVRILEQAPHSSFMLAERFVVSLLKSDEQVAGLVSTDDSFVTSTYSHYRSRWDDADSFSLRTPPLSEIRETLDTEIGPTAVADFDRVLETLERARGNGDGLDEVTIALLVAANNGELLYDISRWGEDIRLASKATFSRSKNQLEDKGLIDTEKVPIDVGRPRLRLMLGDTDLRKADIEDVAKQAETTLK